MYLWISVCARWHVEIAPIWLPEVQGFSDDMSTIDIDRMYHEMQNTMKHNFTGSVEERYIKAKKLFLESVEESIEANKKELIKEFKEGNANV